MPLRSGLNNLGHYAEDGLRLPLRALSVTRRRVAASSGGRGDGSGEMGGTSGALDDGGRCLAKLVFTGRRVATRGGPESDRETVDRLPRPKAPDRRVHQYALDATQMYFGGGANHR